MTTVKLLKIRINKSMLHKTHAFMDPSFSRPGQTNNYNLYSAKEQPTSLLLAKLFLKQCYVQISTFG